MCPACMTSLALAVGGLTSAGGVTALLVHRFRRRRKTGGPPRNPPTREKTP
jgi:hypothetical protein